MEQPLIIPRRGLRRARSQVWESWGDVVHTIRTERDVLSDAKTKEEEAKAARGRRLSVVQSTAMAIQVWHEPTLQHSNSVHLMLHNVPS